MTQKILLEKFSQKNYDEEKFYALENFVSQHEKFSMSFMNKILENKKCKKSAFYASDFFLLKNSCKKNQQKICGALCVFHNSQIFHCFPNPKELANSCALENFFCQNDFKNLFSIIGESHGTEELVNAAQKKLHKNPKIKIEYFLMECDLKNFFGESNFCKDFFLATQKDLLEIFPLRAAYEIEEVLFDREIFNAEFCLRNLKKMICEKKFFVLKSHEKIKSTLAINAFGKNCLQIGGIFTEKKSRKKGFAKKIILGFKNFALQNGTQKIVLFVKKTNPALKLYESCDFKKFGSYTICYY